MTEKKQLIKKNTKATVSNDLNTMIFEQKDLTMQAFRMFMFYLSKIDPKKPDKTEIKVPLKEYAKMVGVELNEKAIDKSTTMLLGCIVKTKPRDLAGGEFEEISRKVQLFSESSLIRRKKDGEYFLTFKCHDELKSQIFNLSSKFTKFEVWNILNLSNLQDMRMYMLLCQYRVAKERNIKLKELKEMLGIDKNAYPEYKIFARAVLKKSQQALRERTDIKFDFKSVGRPAHSVYFEISSNSEYTLLKYLENTNKAEGENDVPGQLSLFEQPTHSYDDDHVAFLASACDFEFNQAEMTIIISAINEKLIKARGCSEETFEKAQHDFLFEEYKTMNTQEALKAAEGGSIKQRLNYLIGIIKKRHSQEIKEELDLTTFYEN